MSKSGILIVVVVAFFLSACVPPRIVPYGPTDPTNPLKRVAVLPMKNDTNDVDGPNLVREKMSQTFMRRSYVIKDVKETDQILRDQMGISLGGQLDLTTPQKLGEALNVEGVLYGTLMDFDETTTGVYNVRKVRAKFRLVDTLTGQTVWERGLGVRSEMRMEGSKGDVATIIGRLADPRDKEAPWVTIENIAAGKTYSEALAYGLGTKLLTKALGIHLDRESTELARLVTENLRWGPGAAAAATATRRPMAPSTEMKMPSPPSFAYMDFGRRDFSAVIVSNSADKSGAEGYRLEIPLAKMGNNIRMDIDLTSMGNEKPSASVFSTMSTIYREDRKESYTLYPNAKKYLVHTEKDKGYYREGAKIEKTRLGKEMVGGHPTDKYRVKVIHPDGAIEEGTVWNARDLDGMTIKSVMEGTDFKVTTEMKNIDRKAPPRELFEIPEDYNEAKNAMELMIHP